MGDTTNLSKKKNHSYLSKLKIICILMGTIPSHGFTPFLSMKEHKNDGSHSITHHAHAYEGK